MSSAAWILFEASHMEKHFAHYHSCSAHDIIDHLSANPSARMTVNAAGLLYSDK